MQCLFHTSSAIFGGGVLGRKWKSPRKHTFVLAQLHTRKCQMFDKINATFWQLSINILCSALVSSLDVTLGDELCQYHIWTDFSILFGSAVVPFQSDSSLKKFIILKIAKIVQWFWLFLTIFKVQNIIKSH